MIDRYMRFSLGSAVCSVPYFNNKTMRSRVALNALVGKGDPQELLDETETIIFKNHIDPDTLEGETLKRIMADENLGVDCSALAYHVLDAESQARGKGQIKRSLKFIQAHGLKGFIASRTRPARLADVATFADDANSRHIELSGIRPGDMITMMDGSDDGERNHILVVHQIDRNDPSRPKIHYTHAVAYPEDGLYGSGVKQGTIEIVDPSGNILEQAWQENGSAEGAARILSRARHSKTDVRRLKWL